MNTNTLMLAAALVLGSVTLAAADSSFSLSRVQDSDGLIELDNVRSDADGVIEIYSFNTGMEGDLLGSQVVTMGANSDLRIGLRARPMNDVIAVLKIDGAVVASQEIDLERNSRNMDM